MPLDHGTRGRVAAAAAVGVLAGVFLWLGRSPGPEQQSVAQPRKEAELPLPAPVPVNIPEAPSGEANPPQAAEQATGGIGEDPDLALALPAGTVLPPPPLLEPVWQFPTENVALLQSRPEKFFMFVDRPTATGRTEVWQGGDYGFVRNPRQIGEGTVYTKFHEGIDIAPVVRDARQEPQDDVRAVGDGVVAYVTASAHTSNYGNYVVLLHRTPGFGEMYSLYAHLRNIAVKTGSPVARGAVLGKLGYTGDGIDRRRAHVHLEMGLVLSERFDELHRMQTAQANPHGNYHGNNLAGFNAGAFLSAHATDPRLAPEDWIRKQPEYFRILVPNRGTELAITRRLPWLRGKGPAAASWEISCTGEGIPLSVLPSASATGFPSISWIKTSSISHTWNTRSLVGGTGSTGVLTGSGQQFVRLLTDDF